MIEALQQRGESLACSILTKKTVSEWLWWKTETSPWKPLVMSLHLTVQFVQRIILKISEKLFRWKSFLIKYHSTYHVVSIEGSVVIFWCHVGVVRIAKAVALVTKTLIQRHFVNFLSSTFLLDISAKDKCCYSIEGSNSTAIWHQCGEVFKYDIETKGITSNHFILNLPFH